MMHSGMRIRRALAVTTALTVATLGAVSTAQARPGHDNGHHHGQAGGHGNGTKGAGGHGKSHGKSHAGTHGNGHASGRATGHAQGHANGHAGEHAQRSGGHGRGPAAREPKSHAGGGHGGDPAGNNGTVKITPPGEDDGIPQNHPHQGCVFDIEWYGFDEGDAIVSTVTFADHAPTADAGLTVVEGQSQVFVGGDPASGAGTGSGFDGEETYRLAFAGEPHPQQGYHVTLTVHTPGSRGSDTKHKVYWVEGCEETTTPPGEEETTPSGETAPPEVAGTETTAPPATGPRGPEVLGEQQTAPTGLPTAVNAGVATVKWATSPLPLLVALLGVLLAGVGYLVRRRRVS